MEPLNKDKPLKTESFQAQNCTSRVRARARARLGLGLGLGLGARLGLEVQFWAWCGKLNKVHIRN